MPELFGLNIAEIVDTSLQSAGGVLTGTLTKFTPGTRTPGDISGGTNPTPTDYAIRGFIENRTSTRIGDSLIGQTGEFVSILGNSLPENIEPEEDDNVTIEGRTFRIIEVTQRDPAAALYVVRVEE